MREDRQANGTIHQVGWACSFLFVKFVVIELRECCQCTSVLYLVQLLAGPNELIPSVPSCYLSSLKLAYFV